MPLFVDPNAKKRLEFGDTLPDSTPCPADLRGQWIEVVESIGDAEWQEISATVLSAHAEGNDLSLAFTGKAGIERMARWITDVSFVNLKGEHYPRQNLVDRRRWLGGMFPPVANAVRAVLDAHVQAAWSVADPELDPKADASSGQE